MSKQFVGFGTAAEWRKNIKTDQPVNFECVTQSGTPGKMGISLVKSFVVLSQNQAGEVLYLYVLVDRYQAMNGEPLDDKKDAHRRRGETAEQAAEEWLKAQGITYRKALIAFPRGLTLLEGVAEFLQYDKETDSYVMAPETALP